MQSEPALIMGLINAAIALGVGFGLPVTIQQAALINAFAAAVLAVITRQSVIAPDTHNDIVKAMNK